MDAPGAARWGRASFNSRQCVLTLASMILSCAGGGRKASVLVSLSTNHPGQGPQPDPHHPTHVGLLVHVEGLAHEGVHPHVGDDAVDLPALEEDEGGVDVLL